MKKVKKFIAVFTAALAVGTSGMAVSANEVDYAIDVKLSFIMKTLKAYAANLQLTVKKLAAKAL